MKKGFIRNAILMLLTAVVACGALLRPDTAYAWKTKTHGYSANLILKDAADGDVKYFKELRVDGQPFNKGVRISSGSTVADISAKTMETLSVGEHTVTFVYVDGEASAQFTVRQKMPPTGDADHPWLWLSLMALGIAGLALYGRHLRATKKKN